MENFIKCILSCCIGVFIGFYIMINTQKVVRMVHNPNGYNVYTIQFLGQNFNYIDNNNLSSIND